MRAKVGPEFHSEAFGALLRLRRGHWGCYAAAAAAAAAAAYFSKRVSVKALYARGYARRTARVSPLGVEK